MSCFKGIYILLLLLVIELFLVRSRGYLIGRVNRVHLIGRSLQKCTFQWRHITMLSIDVVSLPLEVKCTYKFVDQTRHVSAYQESSSHTAIKVYILLASYGYFVAYTLQVSSSCVVITW
jgi:hypothetical protein